LTIEGDNITSRNSPNLTGGLTTKDDAPVCFHRPDQRPSPPGGAERAVRVGGDEPAWKLTGSLVPRCDPSTHLLSALSFILFVAAGGGGIALRRSAATRRPAERLARRWRVARGNDSLACFPPLTFLGFIASACRRRNHALPINGRPSPRRSGSGGEGDVQDFVQSRPRTSTIKTTPAKCKC
jgi:hypothetical protein